MFLSFYLLYQEESIKSRIDYFNVKTMLDIEKERIITKYEALFTQEDIEYEKENGEVPRDSMPVI